MSSQQAKHKDPLEGFYAEPPHRIRDWKGLMRLYQKTFSAKATLTQVKDGWVLQRPEWIFRGQRTDWQLETTLDRACERYGILPEWKDEEGKLRDRRDVEKAMLRSFMRKAHHYLTHAPSSDDLLEWLAIMRHFGAPARLFDWTYSFWVAVYNAVENWPTEDPKLLEGEKWPVVWALDATWLKKNPSLSAQERRARKGIEETRQKDNRVVKHLMTHKSLAGIYNATGFRLNERLIAQQGTFLVQGSLAKPFSENLMKSLKKRNTKKHFWRICLKIDGHRRDEILCELNNMHINHATLYPDLEGFAKSLERHMAYPENWGFDVDKEY